MTDKGSPSDCSSRACPNDPFCLGMCEYTGCITHPTPLKISLPFPPDSHSPDPPLDSAIDSSHSPIPADPPLNSAHSRFTANQDCSQPASKRFRLASAEELSQLSKGFTPENTDKSTKWALTNFRTGPKRKMSTQMTFCCLQTQKS